VNNSELSPRSRGIALKSAGCAAIVGGILAVVLGTVYVLLVAVAAGGRGSGSGLIVIVGTVAALCSLSSAIAGAIGGATCRRGPMARIAALSCVMLVFFPVGCTVSLGAGSGNHVVNIPGTNGVVISGHPSESGDAGGGLHWITIPLLSSLPEAVREGLAGAALLVPIAGVIGWSIGLLIGLMPGRGHSVPGVRTCPRCAQPVASASPTCPHCGALQGERRELGLTIAFALLGASGGWLLLHSSQGLFYGLMGGIIIAAGWLTMRPGRRK